jgi:transposase
MSDEQIRQLYRKGEDATVAFIVALLKELEQLKKPQPPTASPSTASGMRPVYSKPAKKGKAKTPGRKKGHVGVRRQKPERIDKREQHTFKACPDCHHPVGESFERRIRYTEEIVPLPTEVTEHTIHRYWCVQCKKVVEPKVTAALPKSTIGLKTLVFSCWLHYAQGITLEKILQIFNQAFQMKISKGALVQAWHHIAQILKPIYHDIAKQAKQSAVLHIDETGWRVCAATYWLWCFSNDRLVYFVIDRSRGSPVVKKVLGHFFQGILISDFFSAYNCLIAMAKQKCFSHLFTELAKVDVRNKSDQWKKFRKKLSRFLKDAIRVHKNIKELDEKQLADNKNQLHKRLQEMYAQTYQDRDTKRLANRLEKHKDELLTFLDHPEISHDNNHVERQLRPAVISIKNSYCNRSEKGAETQAIFMSIFRTLYLRNGDPIESLMNMVKYYLNNNQLPARWEDSCTSNG